MADDTARRELERKDAAYFEGQRRPLDEYGSVILTNSKYLNSAELRDLYAQEGLRRDGTDVPSTFLIHRTNKAFAELCDEDHVGALIAAERKIKPEFAAWLDARRLSDFTLDELKDHKPGTLGRIIHDYFAGQPGFELNFTNRAVEPTSDYRYLVKQRTLAHDIDHLVSGLGPNPVGEHALIACNLKAYYNYFTPELAGALTPMTGFLMSTGIMKINLHYPRLMGTLLDAIAEGRRIGDGMKHPFLIVDWRSYLDWPMDEVRRDLNVVGAPAQGTWDWTHEMRKG